MTLRGTEEQKPSNTMPASKEVVKLNLVPKKYSPITM